MSNEHFILFDGTCGFCHKSVLFIAKRDLQNAFVFVSNQSTLGKELLTQYRVSEWSEETIVLIHNKSTFIKGAALIKILGKLPRWKMVGKMLSLVPRPLLNWGYDFVAKNRKGIFPLKHCRIPNTYDKARFVL